ncbi:MAG: hypothetical protein GC164_03380 [Phycisphaera sp.]|nr:hypothetical protein [Phycisphaera sp.]
MRRKAKRLSITCRVALAVALAGCVLRPDAASAAAQESGAKSRSPRRVVIVVPMNEAACEQDFAFLAAVPAGTRANSGHPALLVVDSPITLRPETSDFLRRYKPTEVYELDFPTAGQPPEENPQKNGEENPQENPVALPLELVGCKKLSATSAEQAACVLATAFWKQSDTVVICDAGDYANALCASALASRLDAPLLYSSNAALSPVSQKSLQDLGVKRCVFVGTQAPPVEGVTGVRLTDAVAVLAWMRSQGLPVDYLAVANPRDRALGRVLKSSLGAPLLAAGRSGAVALLDFGTVYKQPIEAMPTDALTLPESVKVPPDGKAGTIALDGHTALFTLNSKSTKLKLFDPDGKPRGTYETGGRLPLGDRMYTVALDPESGRGKADLWLTWPGVPEMRSTMKGYYDAMGREPQYLCLLGWPDVIPQAIIRNTPGQNMDLPSDVPLADTDDDPFVELALGRLLGEDLYSTILTATRGLVYDDLIDPSWSQRLGLSGWCVMQEDEYRGYGFEDIALHASKEGKITQDSAMCQTAAIMHGEHSSWQGMGGFMYSGSNVLFAPTLIESSGCSTMRLDRDKLARSIPARQLRNGAVCVAGNTRNGIGKQGLYRSEFWNALMRNQTVGQAHRDALNRQLMAVLENDETDRGGFRYEFYIRALYGDPALRIKLPAPSQEQPAFFERDGSRVTVHSPGKWTCGSHAPNPDWKCPHEKIFSAAAPGIGNEKRWDSQERHDTTDYYYTVELKTDQHIRDIKQERPLPEPLGWSGRFYVDEHQDGTRSILWRVRMFEIDDDTGQTTQADGPVGFEMTAE